MNSQLIDTGVATALQGARKWAKGYAWIMAVYLALMAIGMVALMFFSSSPMSDMTNAGLGMIVTLIILLFALALMLPPILYLFGFVRNSEAALASGDPSAFASGLTNLKSFFKFYVILVIVMIVIYALVLLAALAMGGLQNLIHQTP